MNPPSPTLATHLILVVPQIIGRDVRLGQTSNYEDSTGTMYLGIVEPSGLIEQNIDDAIRSVELFQVFLFSAPDPVVLSQYVVKWRWIASPVIPGTIPDNSTWEAYGVAQADSKRVNNGCWKMPVTVTT